MFKLPIKLTLIGGILLIISSCEFEEHSNKSKAPSLKLLDPNPQTSVEQLMKLDLKRIPTDIPQFEYQKGDTLIYFTLNFDEDEVISEEWIFNTYRNEDDLSDFLDQRGATIIDDYINGGSLDSLFAVSNRKKWLFTCRWFKEEENFKLAILFHFPENL